MLALNYELTLMVLCFVPFIVIYGHLPQILPPGLPQGQGRDHRHQHLPVGESVRHQGHADLWPRGREDGGVPREKPAPRPREPGADLCVRRVSSSGLHAVYLLDPVSFYLGGMGHLNGVTFLGQTITGGTIVTFYMYISKFFTPIQNLAEQFNWLQSALASSRRCSPSWTLRPKWWTPPTHRAGRGKGRNRVPRRLVQLSSGRVGAAGRVLPHSPAPDRGVCRLDGLGQEHDSLADLPQLRVPEGRDPD